MKMYIAVLEDVPDHMVPVLVAHAVLGAHRYMNHRLEYQEWLADHFFKVVLRVNQKEFDKIAVLDCTYLGYERTVLNAEHSCAVALPVRKDNIPNVLKFAKLWSPK